VRCARSGTWRTVDRLSLLFGGTLIAIDWRNLYPRLARGRAIFFGDVTRLRCDDSVFEVSVELDQADIHCLGRQFPESRYCMPADDVVRNGQTVQYVTLSESFRGSLEPRR